MKGTIADGITIKVGQGIITIPRDISKIPRKTGKKPDPKEISRKPPPEKPGK